MTEEDKKSESEELLDEIEQHSGDGNADADEALQSVAFEIDNANDKPTDSAPTVEEELSEAKSQILKLHAELDNVRKRVRREAEDQIRYASLPLMQDLLQVLDNLKRAVDAAGSSGSSEGLIEGVQMVTKQFQDTFAKHHCKVIPALGEAFDPNFHEAIQQMPSDDYESGQVMLEATQGYKLHDRVVRPSQVIVSTGKAGE